MARPISDEELDLKKRARRRLVGAIVLVTAVAVVLPMVLDTEPKPVSQNVDIQIPAPDIGEFKLKGGSAAPAAKAPPATAPAPETPKLQMDSKVAVAEPTTKVPSSEGKPPSKESGKPEKTAEAPKATASGAFVVQVEALADVTKAKRLREKIAAAGLPVYTEVVSTGTGELTRVRAGPYESREAAEKARAELRKAGFEGKVVVK